MLAASMPAFQPASPRYRLRATTDFQEVGCISMTTTLGRELGRFRDRIGIRSRGRVSFICLQLVVGGRDLASAVLLMLLYPVHIKSGKMGILKLSTCV